MLIMNFHKQQILNAASDNANAYGVDGISYSYVYKMNIVCLTIMKTMLIKDNQSCFDADRRNVSYHPEDE